MLRLLLSLLLFITLSSAIVDFGAERIAQYSRNDQTFGPQRMGAAGVLAVAGSEALRRVEIVSVDCITSRVDAALAIQSDDPDSFSRAVVGGSSAVIVVVPPNVDKQTTEKWLKVETSLLTHPLQAPVFVTRNTTVVSRFGLSCGSLTNNNNNDNQNTQNSASGFWLLRDELYATINAAEAVAVKPWRATNVVARLPASDPSAPTIAIIASYDAMAGETKSAYAAAGALVQTARLLARLRAAPKSNANSHIVFVAAAGASANFAGTVEWLKTSSVDVAICLDELSHSPLVLRASRPSKDESARRLYETFSAAADSLGIEFEQQIEKVNLEEELVRWEHEHFSRARLLGATLSSRTEPLRSPMRGSLVDSFADQQSIIRAANLVAEVVARLAYEHNLPANSRLIDEDDGQFIGAWFNASVIPSIGDKSIVSLLRSALNATIEEVTTAEFVVDASWTFFAQQPATVVVHVTKPYVFDFVVALLVLAYLLALHVSLRGPQAIDNLRSLIGR